ncbi:MAG TPA: molybdopterin-synthase adenylyltransferase MoeB [Burkholderiales bacterium]|jgi:molybdopterin/thiamine biosynthesis adenylyltransferase|nr:molybdopterin-synthase adenylyltransferase MoeB [Burkholderiales bacterium]
MDDNQLLRYSRHILLPEIGIDGQERLRAARALVIGAGGLGAPVALYLASSGVGRLVLCDHDSVDLTNLQRQIVHFTDSIGRAKVDSARETLARINPEVEVQTVLERVAGQRLEALVRDTDVVVDCTDNFVTRHAINRACVRYRKPLVSGAAVRFDGQIAVFDLRRQDSACYHCLFPEEGDFEEMRCAVMGVFAPVVGIIGTVQAAETLKLLMGIGETLNGRLLMLDALSMQWRSIRLRKDPDCRVCSRGDTAQREAAAACAAGQSSV